jgi:hypothetical protein
MTQTHRFKQLWLVFWRFWKTQFRQKYWWISGSYFRLDQPTKLFEIHLVALQQHTINALRNFEQKIIHPTKWQRLTGWKVFTLKMKAARSFETSVSTYDPTRCQTEGGYHLVNTRRQNLTTDTLRWLMGNLKFLNEKRKDGTTQLRNIEYRTCKLGKFVVREWR